MRVVFMGSPDFALPSLHILANHHDLVGVITQPDRHAGRGRKLVASAVKLAASEIGLRILQPDRLKNPSVPGQLRELDPEVIVVAAYGQILPAEILELPPHGCINVHASLLPRWRGAAPIPAAILHGDRLCGVTIMKMDAGLDTGPIISQRQSALHPDDTSATLSDRLAIMGAQLLHETLPSYCSGRLTPRLQDDSHATYAPVIRKSDGILDWRKTAADLERQIRAYIPWPGSFFEWKAHRIIVLRARAIQDESSEQGVVSLFSGLPAVGTSAGILVLETVQPAGRKQMTGSDFLRGAQDFSGTHLLLPE